MFDRIAAYFDTHFIRDWRAAWRYLSVQAGLIFAALSFAWPMLGDEQKLAMLSVFGANPEAKLVLISFLSILVARWKSQPSTPGREVTSFAEFRQYLSAKLSIAGAVLTSAWLALNVDQQNALLSLLPFNINMNTVVTLGFVSVVYGRLKKQDLVLN